MEKVDELVQKLSNIARNVTESYAQNTLEESKSARKQLDNLQQQIKGIFRQYIGVVPDKVIADLTEQTNTLLKRTIESSRVSERNDTVSNLGDARADTVSGMQQGLQKFKLEGITQDKRFETEIDEIVVRVGKAYQKVLDQVQVKGADMALAEIKGHTRRTFNNVMSLHEEYTAKIKREALSEVEKLGIELSEADRRNIEEQSSKQTASLSTQLKSHVESLENVTNNDVAELSANRAAFKDGPNLNKGPVQDNKAMFK